MPTIHRLPEVRPLSQMLPRGTEGGKEFARIIDLLLFYSSARRQESINLFSDRSGDFHGLDSIAGGYRQENNIGYQYKFYPSPLSPKHRSEIISSLKQAASNQKQLKLKRWILVTPDDLTQSSTKTGGGDVEWFSKLQEQLKISFEVEHWGHRKLQALFLETPHLCLYYYPELIPQGKETRSNFADTRKKYDANMAQLNERIEFIGMSVYKAEATHGVAMEEIYIPVSVVPHASSPSNPLQKTRVNPLTFLNPGARHVILGDPGSGKSTLIKFLSIAGRSIGLQKKYGARQDNRIAISVTLRKYSDAIKENRTLSLLDHISMSARADYSVPSASNDFFEYYLESGQAIVLFDGMDELPDANFKQIVRDRIISFLNCYPMSAAIITSRIVGYSAAFGFDSKRFEHFQMAPLLLEEIESFVRDWYRVRVENEVAREANIKDLIRILQNPEQRAIRTLAENPLLLTIVALVHRIDAVLPDERVVLYQKCTETLLNTWHTWKYKGSDDALRRGRMERTNRRRIETLAEYMHVHAGQATKQSRAILPEQEVIRVLFEDIKLHDSPESDGEAEDMAKEFLEFVKQKAGLLIEVGDRQYSFIHLTFQEYLTATALTAKLELGGVKQLWTFIKTRLRNPRWHEVTRLLVAGLKSDKSQAYIVTETIKQNHSKSDLNTALLLGGLLLDGVKSAELKKEEILAALFKMISIEDDYPASTRIDELLSTLAFKHSSAWDHAFHCTWRSTPELRARMLLLTIAIKLPLDRRDKITAPQDLSTSINEIENFALFLGSDRWKQNLHEKTIIRLAQTEKVLHEFARRSPFTNFVACAAQSIFTNCDEYSELKKLFHIQLFISQGGGGPFNDFYRNYSIFALCTRSDNTPLVNAQLKAIHGYVSAYRRSDSQERRKEMSRRRGHLEETSAQVAKALRLIRQSDDLEKRALDGYPNVSRDILRFKFRDIDKKYPALMDEMASAICSQDKQTSDEAWEKFISKEEFTSPYIEAITTIFNLKPKHLWEKAIRNTHFPKLRSNPPDHLSQNRLEILEERLRNSQYSEADLLHTACFLLYDVWLFIFSGYSKIEESPIFEVIKSTESLDHPILNVAKNIRLISLGLA